VAIVSGHHRRVVDFLGVVQLAAAGVAGRVHVADDVAILLDASQQVAVHDLHVIDVEEQLQPW
jgi:hypothetical protein